MKAIIEATGWFAFLAFCCYFLCGIALAFVRSVPPAERFAPILILCAAVFCGNLHTPGAWSDVRSQWLPPLALLVLLFAVGAHGLKTTFRSRHLPARITGMAGLALFTFATPLFLSDLYGTVLLFEQIRSCRN